jgi:serine protease Do
MKRTLGLIVIIALLAIPLMASAAGKKPGKGGAAPVKTKSSESVFGRDLVNKVKKGVIAIWALGNGDGVLEPAWIGSGFIFQSLPDERAAYALTNHHVAQGTAMLQCELWDNSTYKAQMVMTEPGIDIALIKLMDIPPDAYEVNVIGDSDQVVIGEPALAMGAPGSAESYNANRSDPSISFGLHETATLRVVTGKQTDPWECISAWVSWQNELGREVITNLPWRFVVQSAINGGNSGGPLYNAKGEVIGLNHAHFGPGATVSQNENYTIPINYAKNFADQIINTGKYELPWCGLDLIFPPNLSQRSENISEFVEKYYDPKVIRIHSIRRDSPGTQAVPEKEADGIGLRKGDIILEFDGQAFPTVVDLRLYVFTLPIGKEVPVVVKRGKQKVNYKLTIGVKRSYDSEFAI